MHFVELTTKLAKDKQFISRTSWKTETKVLPGHSRSGPCSIVHDRTAHQLLWESTVFLKISFLPAEGKSKMQLKRVTDSCPIPSPRLYQSRCLYPGNWSSIIKSNMILHVLGSFWQGQCPYPGKKFHMKLGTGGQFSLPAMTMKR